MPSQQMLCVLIAIMVLLYLPLVYVCLHLVKTLEVVRTK